MLPDRIRTVYVAPWGNRTNVLELGARITEALRREFLLGGGLVLADRAEADVILEGEVVAVDTTGLSYTRYDVAVERNVRVEVSARLRDRRTGEVLWETVNLRRDEPFLVGANVQDTESLEALAFEKIGHNLAELIYHRVTGMF
nr:LptE family protein [Dissulfurirhabdus thermomarina]